MKLDRTRIAIEERNQRDLLDLTFLVLRQFFLPITGLVCLLAVPLPRSRGRRRIYHVDRGYERIEEKLRQLGASIRRIE